MAVRGRPFPKGVSGNPSGRAKNPPANIVMMAKKASGEGMAWLIELASGRIKGATIDQRMKAWAMIHERGWGKPAQNVSVDVALKRAVESKDPIEKLKALEELRALALQSPQMMIDLTPVVEVEEIN
jgi:hypothetical protein